MDLVDSKFLHVWYMIDFVDSKGKTNGITSMIFEPLCYKTNKVILGSSKTLMHLPSLIRLFAMHSIGR